MTLTVKNASSSSRRPVGPTLLRRSSYRKIPPLVAFHTVLIKHFAAGVVDHLPCLSSPLRAVDFKGAIEEKLPAANARDIVVRLDIVADLGIGDRSVLDEGGPDKGLSASNRERRHRRTVGQVQQHERVSPDHELRRHTRWIDLKTEAAYFWPPAVVSIFTDHKVCNLPLVLASAEDVS